MVTDVHQRSQSGKTKFTNGVKTASETKAETKIRQLNLKTSLYFIKELNVTKELQLVHKSKVSVCIHGRNQQEAYFYQNKGDSSDMTA